MGVGQRLEMRQGQSLVMTPQLQQAIKLLQLSNLELTDYCETELERNPLLERDETASKAEPEREVVASHLEQLRGLSLDLVGDLLVEHDETRVRAVEPTEVDGASLGRRLPRSLREFLDLVGGHAEAEDIAVEAECHLHVPHTDGHV